MGDAKTLLQSNEKLEGRIFAAISDFQVSIQRELSSLSADLSETRSWGRSSLLDAWQIDHKDRLLSCSDALSTIIRDEKENRSTNLLLHSLEFPQLHERRDKIAKAHSDTFDWILENASVDVPSTYKSFPDWLRAKDEHSGIYWITGKPGSGKSTLMRYLYEDERTKEYLREWADTQSLSLASCFFWNAGTSMQKSLNGLLQSMIHEILSQYPKLASRASPRRWQLYDLGLVGIHPWTDTELLEAFQCIIRATESSAKICFFVDGLDEFEGDESSLTNVTNMLNALSRHQHVKICLSSRPWLIFEDAFKSAFTLILQDLTRNDIFSYVKAELETNERFKEFGEEYTQECSQLPIEVVDKASGVFLWVYLVTRSLLEGLRNGDSVRDLQRRLRTIPADLEEYLAHIVDSLEPSYLEQATQLFEVTLSAHEPLSLLTYSFVHEDNPDFAINAKVEAFSQAHLDYRLTQTRRRLNSRCKGLLEVYKRHDHRNEHVFCLETVDFLHRSVRDFLLTKRMQALIAKSQAEHIDVNTTLCRAYLAQIKAIYTGSTFSYLAFRVFLDGFFEYARRYERATTKTQYEMIMDLDKAVKEIWRCRRLGVSTVASLYHWSCDPLSGEESRPVPVLIRYKRGTILLLAMAACLPRFVKQRLTEYANLEGSDEVHLLLLLALGVKAASHDFVNPAFYRPMLEPDLDLVEYLLSRGANPGYCYNGIYSIISVFVSTLDRFGSESRHPNLQVWLKATHLLIDHHAFSNVDHKLSVVPALREHSSIQSRPISTILKDVFGDEEYSRLESSLKTHQSPGRRVSIRFKRMLGCC